MTDVSGLRYLLSTITLLCRQNPSLAAFAISEFRNAVLRIDSVVARKTQSELHTLTALYESANPTSKVSQCLDYNKQLHKPTSIAPARIPATQTFQVISSSDDMAVSASDALFNLPFHDLDSVLLPSDVGFDTDSPIRSCIKCGILLSGSTGFEFVLPFNDNASCLICSRCMLINNDSKRELGHDLYREFVSVLLPNEAV